MKTAISISDNLFEKVEEIAEELHLSRSRVFTTAVTEFISRRTNKKILQALNRAHTPETKEEASARNQARRAHIKLRKTEKW